MASVRILNFKQMDRKFVVGVEGEGGSELCLDNGLMSMDTMCLCPRPLLCFSKLLWAAGREAGKFAAPLTFGRFFEDYGNCLRASADFARLYAPLIFGDDDAGSETPCACTYTVERDWGTWAVCVAAPLSWCGLSGGLCVVVS